MKRIVLFVCSCLLYLAAYGQAASRRPQFPGGPDSLQRFLAAHIPQPQNVRTIERKVYLEFTVERNGALSHISVDKSCGDDSLDREAVRIFSLSPKWIPATGEDGKPVKQTTWEWVVFEQPNEWPELEKALSQVKAAEVFSFVEQLPEFPGGTDSLFRFIVANINYPDSARKAGIEGRVFLKFIVDEAGAVNDLQVARSSGSELLDQEAIRVMSLSPAWKPGRQNGKAVKTFYNLPVIFSLEDAEGEQEKR